MLAPLLSLSVCAHTHSGTERDRERRGFLVPMQLAVLCDSLISLHDPLLLDLV